VLLVPNSSHGPRCLQINFLPAVGQPPAGFCNVTDPPEALDGRQSISCTVPTLSPGAYFLQVWAHLDPLCLAECPPSALLECAMFTRLTGRLHLLCSW
jgi:hypothetical protein